MASRPVLQTSDGPEETDYVSAVTPTSHEAKEKSIAFSSTEGEEENAETPKKPTQLVPLSQLFVYADATDYLLMAIGSLASVAAGAARPIQILFFGDAINAFNPSGATSSDEFRAQVNKVARNFTIVGVLTMLCCFLQVACWTLAASRQGKRIRSSYVSAILSKEMGWFDVNNPMELPTRAAEAAVTIQEGMGRQVGDAINAISQTLTGVIISFVKGWKLALIIAAFIPFVTLASSISIRFITQATQDGLQSYGKAGAIAQEALSNARTVHMFNSIEHFVTKYTDALGLSLRSGIRKGFTVGWGMGAIYATMFCAYACGMFFGALFIANDRRDGCTEDCYSGGRVLTVFYGILMGSMALGQAAPRIQAIISARAAAYDVFQVINRRSLIDPLSLDGKKLGQVAGRVDIENVTFAYPSRPDVQICRNYSLTIEAGQTVALVGPSGSGKSTIVSLLERFYDPSSGLVKLDGVDVRDLNVAWLREQIGLVGQEPVLFATTIMENIRNGKPGATDEQVIDAAKMANAYSFITDFPDGFQTDVGDRGAQLSGGQKQRIAIARAILKNPSILLLDEATSALDSESERIVQESLDHLMSVSRRTTIVVAHRLSTIRNADKIAVHSHGSIVELGTHDELMSIENGHYRQLVEAQNRGGDANEKEESIEEDVSMQMERVSSIRGTTRTSSRHSGKQVDLGTEDSENNADEDLPPVPASRIWKLSAPEWKFMVVGGLGAIINSAMFPAWGVLLTKIVVLFFEQRPRDDMIEHARYWSFAFVGLAAVFVLSSIGQHYGFAVVSQRLTMRVRVMTFQAMLRQDISWFDLDQNAAGSLVTHLATDSAILQGMTSDMLNQRLVTVASLAIGFGITFYSSWQMTLLMIATAPVVLFATYIQTKIFSGTLGNRKANDGDAAAGALLSEAIGSIRTVASFNMEKRINFAYVSVIDSLMASDTKGGVIGGLSFGFSQGILFLNLAFMFYIGAKWVSNGTITFEDMFMTIMVITYTMFSLGIAAQNKATQAKAKTAASRIFSLVDRQPAIDATSTEGTVLTQLNGDIAFENVAFVYPSRPDAKIYRNYSLRIRAGQTVALVGASGSGKSTAISLLERFYDPAHGRVTVDGTDLRSFQLPWLRDRISLVSQEPVLFAGTIAENIALGKPGATRADVIEAAKKANAFDFINNFPNGFDTDVGDRGAQVSGGQKQRIAIARAILRDPEVLLLDEATSALDNESERIVQDSLDKLMSLKRRTTIIVAHRLSTVRHADLIAVTQDGAIVEQGTHEQLMSNPAGVYRRLVTRQMQGSM
ncbi:hypothetical protein Poli38472_004374 [Pythium oligandrum]|uniref:Uncharacterized protein n=1 Tax=Pythium oligandrum TaxID=41045 RepID=A0A8K1CA44_PYTOL|nr:hypothetical protein Poli38472_004374 [Pythium oligandrum]|eukprot:TMW59305.1 hypothetical protein Poli38472_004374 [Pythium oligandrum]